MVETCLNAGLPEPIFEEVAGDLVVTFRKYHLSEEILKELSGRQEKIVDYLKVHEKVNRKICMELLNISKDTTVRELSSLQEKGIVKRNGKGKNIYYVLS